mmetsp:Transcript_11377/g.15295  ORF Transcript_11377/g.15295 Transcript_11377/m.15295 type:complete len:96 (+) Transcript_11377:708-995(+)
MAMISLFMFPGAPTSVYNLIFPHIPAISMTQHLVGVLIGKLPLNLCLVKAGQVIRKMHSMSDIMDNQTKVELAVVSLLCMLPLLFNHFCKRSRED